MLWIRKGYRHTLRICNIYYFSTATMVARTQLSVTLYVHSLSCLSCLKSGIYVRVYNGRKIYIHLERGMHT